MNLYDEFVKSRECLNEVKDGKWTRLDDFKKFLVEAKTNGYGSEHASVTADGQKTTITYSSPTYPEFRYMDVYYGTESFHGVETVTINGVEVYAMAYSGIEMVPFKENPSILECLGKALKEGPKKAPHNIRGLDGVTDSSGRYMYKVWYNWLFDGRTTGVELILDTTSDPDATYGFVPALLVPIKDNDKPYAVFQCNFSGGFVL